MLGRRLRLAVIGGAPGSFIGAMHRQAARLDDRYEIVTGILSSDPEKSKKAASELGMNSDRLYSSVHEMLDAESSRNDSADAVAIMTPNDSHFEYSVAALERGFDVICDKPMTNTLEEAETLHKKVQEDRTGFLSDAQLHRLPDGPSGEGDGTRRAVGNIRLVQVNMCRAEKRTKQNDAPSDDLENDPVRGGRLG